jgi:hypothetical protein
MCLYHDKLLVFGSFVTAGDISANGMVQWDGHKWCSFDAFFDNDVMAATGYKDTLYIGGYFWSIYGDSTMPYFAKWDGKALSHCGREINLGTDDFRADASGVYVYPNPSSGSFYIHIPDQEKLREIDVHDMIGREVLFQLNSNADQEIQLTLPDAAVGAYSLSICLSSSPSYKNMFRLLKMP